MGTLTFEEKNVLAPLLESQQANVYHPYSPKTVNVRIQDNAANQGSTDGVSSENCENFANQVSTRSILAERITPTRCPIQILCEVICGWR